MNPHPSQAAMEDAVADRDMSTRSAADARGWGSARWAGVFRLAVLAFAAAPAESLQNQAPVPPDGVTSPRLHPLHYDGPLSEGIRDRALLPCSLSDAGRATYEPMPWPAGQVPFRFDANVAPVERSAALAAMAVIEGWAEVDFSPRTNNENAFLHIQDDAVNSSTVGYTGGVVTIRIFNWNVQGIVVHELLHALGFYHEHQRSDRDAHVRIVMGNVQTGQTDNFSREDGAGTAGPYDFHSLMHYDGCAFSNCCPPGTSCACPPGCETILALPPNQALQGAMGQRAAMSALDVHGLRSLYPEAGWRFVDPSSASTGNGSGTSPWRQVTNALTSAPSGATVFVMPGSFGARGTWSRRMTLEAPVGGVRLQ